MPWSLSVHWLAALRRSPTQLRNGFENGTRVRKASAGTFPRLSTRLRRCSSLGRSRWRAERNSESIEHVHQADRIGEIGKFLVAELGSRGFVVRIRNAGFGYARYRFRPGECDLFADTEPAACIAPHRHQHELFNGNP